MKPLVAAFLLCWTANLVSVERVVDGDTFVAELAIWPKVVVTEHVRVLGVDSPERSDVARWQAAAAFTKGWLADAGAVAVTVCKLDSFGRVLGKVTSQTKGELAAALILAGHGVVYQGSR